MSNSQLPPSSWTIRKLSDICDIILGQSPPGHTYNTSGIGLPFFQGKAEFGDLYPEPVKWCSAPSKIAHENDVLLSVRAPVGPTNMANQTSCIGRGLVALRVKECVLPKFVLYGMRASARELATKATGSTFAAVSGAVVREHLLPLPSTLDEQKQIVEAIETQFARLDDAVASLRRARARLKRYRASVLKAACEGRLVPTEAELARQEGRSYEPASVLLERIRTEREATPGQKRGKVRATPVLDTAQLSKLPDGWAWTTVEQVANEVRYGTSAKTHSDPSGVPVLRMGNIQDGELNLDSLKYLNHTHPEFPALLLQPNDVLFNRTNSAELVGKSALYKRPAGAFSYASYLIRVRIVVPSMARLLVYYINSAYGRTWVRSVVNQQVGQANVNGSKLKALHFPVPPLAEQERIVAEVEQLVSVIEQMEATISANLKRAGSLRQSILRLAFSGRLVPPDGSDAAGRVIHSMEIA